eukprot:523595-Pelagomonas_calceolata.AAC.1
MRIARAEAPCNPLTKRSKREKSMGLRIISTTPCLILCASGANTFFSELDRMCMKLQSKLGGIVSVKTKLFKGLQNA